jgi:hypothetical protein
MAGVIRFVGLLNAAVWCGSAIFLIVGLPPLFSDEMKRLLGAAGVGFAAQTILARFFMLQYVCGAIGLAHVAAEWLWLGRPLWRRNLALLVGLICLALVGGLWIQPRLRGLHQTMYYGQTAEQKNQAGREFRKLHGSSQIANLLVIAGLLWYLWGIGEAPEHPRISQGSKNPKLTNRGFC